MEKKTLEIWKHFGKIPASTKGSCHDLWDHKIKLSNPCYSPQGSLFTETICETEADCSQLMSNCHGSAEGIGTLFPRVPGSCLDKSTGTQKREDKIHIKH